jgi:starch phosphorylase
VAAQDRVARTYRDQAEWTRRSIVNVGHMGKFSSDRTIRQYAAEVWHASPMKVE